MIVKENCLCFLVERPSSLLDVDSGASLLAVPDPFGTLELSDAPGDHLDTRRCAVGFAIALCSRTLLCSSRAGRETDRRTQISRHIFTYASGPLVVV